MPNLFDAKAFNAEAFNYRVERVPNLKTNELLKSRALSGDADIRAVFLHRTAQHTLSLL